MNAAGIAIAAALSILPSPDYSDPLPFCLRPQICWAGEPCGTWAEDFAQCIGGPLCGRDDYCLDYDVATRFPNHAPGYETDGAIDLLDFASFQIMWPCDVGGDCPQWP